MTSLPTDAVPRRTAARLADGREIIYFDESVDATRILTDTRDLPVVEPTSQLRYDALLGEWVGIAGHRQTRTYHPPADACPLCPTTARNLTEIPSPDYDVVVFENRFPSFAGAAGQTAPGTALPFDALPGVGRCEVVCFTSDHDATFAELPPERVGTVLSAWIDRTAAHVGVADRGRQVFCFENRGVEIGVTLAHPHGQIYGYPFVTPRTATMLRSVGRVTGAAPAATCSRDLVDGEIADGRRVVARTTHWVAFVPFAARWPLEVHLYPRVRCPTCRRSAPTRRQRSPEIYLEVLHRMEGVFDDTLPAISAWHQAPVRVGRTTSGCTWSCSRSAGQSAR